MGKAASKRDTAAFKAKVALSITRRRHLASISRSSLYDSPTGESPLNLVRMRLLDGAFLERPFRGAQRMARHLRRQG